MAGEASSSISVSNSQNPVVFFDITIGGQDVGRMKMELFADVVPKTAENMRQLCTGEYRKDGIPQGYKGANFHRVIKDFMIQGGDFVNVSVLLIFSKYTNEAISCANSGPNSNGCQFFITCAKCDFLDGKHVVFGKVIDGLLVMRKIENVPVGPNNRPSLPVVISQCGEM
ncbi:PREDICTED: LOW QUALITY PROTEIN: peptidyl-prolyl cis-trans isomerase H-like [Acropora digitifera]|uniref:LOW QUALITY PROTEIN: peptidyl-prolyl cis-trans isomerase H-like n=1 Tax=Acropora digitifera TaxID=70779 RepID=UPI00077AFC69|nr:PREDICTED: LOW QUALITY PROTEIN: peptidyl-prolyl cis-trans isomerase H-like [Acropora digitifera]